MDQHHCLFCRKVGNLDKIFKKIILVHYHEIGLKGANRSYFEKSLERNIKTALKKFGFNDFLTRRISGRILLDLSENIDNNTYKEIFSLIGKIPGCARVSSGFKCLQNVDAMIKAGCEVMRNFSQDRLPESFKLSARRNHTNFELDSMELNQIVGGRISDEFPEVKVQMKEPELDIRLEVIENSCYVYGKSEPGVGGLPVGTGGKQVAMLSSGIDSPVAL